MKVQITLLMAICSFFSIIINFNIYKTIIILIIMALELIQYYSKKDIKVSISILQSIIIVLCIGYKNEAIQFIFPLIIYKLLYTKVKIYWIVVLDIIVLLLIRVLDFEKMVLIIILINMYLYNYYNNLSESTLLKKDFKDRRERSYILENKLEVMDKHIEQSNRITQLKEREVIAQKLHDHLGHRVISAIMQLEVSKETIDTDTKLSRKYLNTAITSLRDGMEEIRSILKNIKPTDKTIGIETIKEMISRFEYSSTMKANLTVEGNSERINYKQWKVIQENIMEALTNSAKYSQGTSINISIYIYNKISRIEIKDNGQGAKIDRIGLGLTGMKKRLEEIGGRFDYYNDNGFVINMVIMLEG